ncbi:MAG TPA: ETC complex I subunit, partial [Caulobacteraceae bacterium]|nr:ETC complex I subunit [Caulobacteraceae bacterium]
GKANTRDWVLEFEPATARIPEPLMGWTSSTDMNGQVRLAFESKDEAVSYAQTHGIAFQLSQPQEPELVIKAYADNFSVERKEPWTH